MKATFEYLPTKQIQLDFSNPRISRFLQYYADPSKIPSDKIALALGAGTSSEKDANISYGNLKESIKANRGLIHPIVVNKLMDGTFVVIEGNTRVQIYKEFSAEKVPGDWDSIISIVHDNLSDEQIHAIRLQSHLVGPRDWDPYSKARYLSYLSNEEKMPLIQICALCGGKYSEIKKYIDAFNDFEKYYCSQIDDDTQFSQTEFSKFVELQNRSIKDSLLINQFDISDFAKWVINGNIDAAQRVRMIPSVLKDKDARKVFLEENISEAIKILNAKEIDIGSIKDIPYEVLADELISRMRHIEFIEIQNLRSNEGDRKRATLLSLFDELKSLVDYIKEEG